MCIKCTGTEAQETSAKADSLATVISVSNNYSLSLTQESCVSQLLGNYEKLTSYCTSRIRSHVLHSF